jgi:hypothetical protein
MAESDFPEPQIYSSAHVLMRAFVLPWQPQSLIFVGLIAMAFAVTAIVHEQGAILRLIPAAFLVSWTFKYAYVVLDEVANGGTNAPTVSIDMLSPFETRPLMQLLLCGGVGLSAMLLGGVMGLCTAGAYVILLPASVAVLGLTRSALAAINPWALLRTARGLGPYYALIVCSIAGMIALLGALDRLGIWNVLWYAAAELVVLHVFSLIGACVHTRRLQLGFEPRSSPERHAQRAMRERDTRRDRMLDDAFVAIRSAHFRRAAETLWHWLSQCDADEAAAEALLIVSRAANWSSERGLAVAARCAVTYLLQAERVEVAFVIVETTLARQPNFALDSEREVEVITRLAHIRGRDALADAVSRNYEGRRAAPAIRGKGSLSS